ncbi:MAG TPA: endonuclease/exonuclease/phosphatase family protein [Solirubrobacterales bacterium]|nr:endonuclease/exonuclease/phosphatase family protein [Solirubrobacterales bacterium]
MNHRIAPGRTAALALFAAAAALLACLACAGFAEAKPKKDKGTVVNVMTRNLYLGADLGPALSSTSQAAFFEANGGIVRQVEATNFPVRAKGLAAEILENEPDLVGLQEVALWREAPPSVGPILSGKPSAETVKYDFLALLLAQLNKKGNKYKAVVVQDEFDFEAPANANGVPGDGPGGGTGLLANSEVNGRLTMRDVILARVGAGVVTSNPSSGNFVNPLVVKVAGGTEVSVTRGWTAIDAKVRGSKKFHFVNSHLEAFDNEAEYPSFRAKQAGELVAPGGPADSKLPVVLLGDFNSDVKTEVKPGDGQAYRVLKQAGFRERRKPLPNTCCLSTSYDLKTGGGKAEFDHTVDHVMTDTPKKIKLVTSKVTGLKKAKTGWWDSDHAGVFSSLLFLK